MGCPGCGAAGFASAPTSASSCCAASRRSLVIRTTSRSPTSSCSDTLVGLILGALLARPAPSWCGRCACFSTRSPRMEEAAAIDGASKAAVRLHQCSRRQAGHRRDGASLGASGRRRLHLRRAARRAASRTFSVYMTSFQQDLLTLVGPMCRGDHRHAADDRAVQLLSALHAAHGSRGVH